MNPSGPRVLVLRSSRFLGRAIAAARRQWPEARLRVVCQPGTRHEAVEAGPARPDVVILPDARRFTPWRFPWTRAGRELRAWRPDEVVIQWTTTNGRGQAALTATALVLHGRRVRIVRADTDEILTLSLAQVALAPLRWTARMAAALGLVAGIAAVSAALYPVMAWRTISRTGVGRRHNPDGHAASV